MDMDEMSHGQKVEAIARAAHEANRGWCMAHDDQTVPPWDLMLPKEYAGLVRGVHVTLSGATPEQQHDAWRQQRASEGWVFGPEKDPERKCHPCMVPYELLSAMQKVKDALFQAVVRALAPPLGLEVMAHA